MRRWGLEAATFIVAIGAGVLVLWAAGVRPDELFDFSSEAQETPLEPLPGVTSAAEVATTTVPSIELGVPSTSAPAELEGKLLCIQHTKTFAFLGDVDALAIWRFVGESDEELERACQQLAREDSRAVAEWRWELAVLAGQTSTTASTLPTGTTLPTDTTQTTVPTFPADTTVSTTIAAPQ